MNKFFAILCTAVGAMCLTACHDDDSDAFLTIEHDGVQVSFKNIDKWAAATQHVAAQLQGKVDAWVQQQVQTRAEEFVKQGSVSEIISGCALTAKVAPQLSEFHSEADYQNNILSIRNSYYGSTDGSVAEASLASLTAALDPRLDSEIRAQIVAAQSDMTASASLAELFAARLAPLYASLSGHDAQLMAVRATYVQAVVLPTISEVKTSAVALYDATCALAANPSDQTFAAAAQAWTEAKAPWERSAAIVAGPFALTLKEFNALQNLLKIS